MMYTKEQSQKMLAELEAKISALESEAEEIRRNTIDDDKEKFGQLVTLLEDANPKVRTLFLTYVFDKYNDRFDLLFL